MKSSIVLALAAAFFCLFAFPTTIVGKNLRFWPQPIGGWSYPSENSRNNMFMSISQRFPYGESKIWRCTYSNGSGPAISISYPSTPSRPLPSPKTFPPPPTHKTFPPPPTPSPPPPKHKMIPPKPKKSPSPSPSPPRPKKSPSPPPPSDDDSLPPCQPSNPTRENHDHPRSHDPMEHVHTCMRNMGDVMRCRVQMEGSYYSGMFGVSDYCCKLVVNMKNECDDVIWGFFTDPYFVPVVRYACHVNF